MRVCEWCGETHDRSALCARVAARGMTRRSFLFLAPAGTAGLVLADKGVAA